MCIVYSPCLACAWRFLPEGHPTAALRVTMVGHQISSTDKHLRIRRNPSDSILTSGIFRIQRNPSDSILKDEPRNLGKRHQGYFVLCRIGRKTLGPRDALAVVLAESRQHPPPQLPPRVALHLRKGRVGLAPPSPWHRAPRCWDCRDRRVGVKLSGGFRLQRPKDVVVAGVQVLANFRGQAPVPREDDLADRLAELPASPSAISKEEDDHHRDANPYDEAHVWHSGGHVSEAARWHDQ